MEVQHFLTECHEVHPQNGGRGYAAGTPDGGSLQIPRRKRRFLKKSHYSLGKNDNFLISTDFRRFLGLSWETIMVHNSALIRPLEELLH